MACVHVSRFTCNKHNPRSQSTKPFDNTQEFIDVFPPARPDDQPIDGPYNDYNNNNLDDGGGGRDHDHHHDTEDGSEGGGRRRPGNCFVDVSSQLDERWVWHAGHSVWPDEPFRTPNPGGFWVLHTMALTLTLTLDALRYYTQCH